MSKFKTHPSTVKIKNQFKIKTTFPFTLTSKDEIVAIIQVLQNNKAPGWEILLNFLKKSNFTFDELTEKRWSYGQSQLPSNMDFF